MVKPKLRVKAPKEAKRGEIVEIMTLISHPMDTGLRKDQDGIFIPRMKDYPITILPVWLHPRMTQFGWEQA